MTTSPGKTLRTACQQQPALPIVGTINAYSAMLAKQAGHKAIYLSGAGVANASCGLPDLGMTNLNDVLTDIRRITSACDLPLLVDADTGWGNALLIARTTKEIQRAGAAGMHIEDQVFAKRCGHRPGKAIVSSDEMVDRIKAAVDARIDNDFVIMARTDAFANEGLAAAVDRAAACIEAGADMIFPEAVHSLEDYQAFTAALSAPVLANITEFGKTPLFTQQQLAQAGVGLVLYPLSAFRAMSKAAMSVYRDILEQGSQQQQVDAMQTREELYQILDYYHYEQCFDKLQSS